VPLDQRRPDCLGDLDRQHGLAGAGLAFDQERTLERDGGVDRDLEVVGRHIAAGAFKTHVFPSVAVVSRTNKHGILAAHKRPTYHFGIAM
jgi:hypothetical protein